MGILDDAIREHLELKRKHGVPEEEVERQEEEALGPARREVAQQPEDAEIAADEAAPSAATEAGDHAAPDETGLFNGERSDTPVTDEPPAAEAPVADHMAMEPPPRDDAQLGATQPHGFPAVEDDEEPEQPDEDEDVVVSDPEHEDPDPEDPDVLEDTPDFLQETPEHDRLWFEQKPPRDFDFD